MSKRLMPEMTISPQGMLLNMGIINKKNSAKNIKKAASTSLMVTSGNSKNIGYQRLIR